MRLLRNTNHLYKYIAGIIHNVHGVAMEINGTEDHIHILTTIPKDISISEFVRTIKSNSSKHLHETYNIDFSWQIGYAFYSVSKSNINQVIDYIQNQEEHHKKIDFQEEFNKFLTAHGFQIINEP